MGAGNSKHNCPLGFSNSILLMTKKVSDLMFLERLGIFHGEIREHVIDRIMALDTQSVDLSQIRWVVLMILFNVLK